ncbi:MAG TPA: hypothetical protein VLS89_09115 [Candidatus Nanopelagicales bacterium]|nr:hypothetical protein [Candidatus Nanopelagicales bacterium]
MISWGVRRGRERAWGAVASELGLTAADGAVHGLLEGQQVHLRLERRGVSGGETVHTVASGILSLPLDLGLDVGPEAPWDDLLAGGQGGDPVRTGDPAFDMGFQIRADEPNRARALLTPALRDTLRRCGDLVRLTDLGVSLSHRGACLDPAWIRWALRNAANVATLVDNARRRVPLATPLAGHRPGWRQLAAELGLNSTRAPLGVWGAFEGSPICAYAARTGPLAYGLEVAVRFERPLGVDLRIKPAGAIDALCAMLGGDDRRVGDPAFDRVFSVRCARSDRLPGVLDAEARERLLELSRRAGAVRVLDEGVSVRAPVLPAEPQAVLELVAQIRDAVARLERNARSGQERRVGPYR